MNYTKTLVYLLDKCEEDKRLACTVFTDKGDSSFTYPEGNKEFNMQIFIVNGMLSWAINGYTYSIDKQEEVHAFVDNYNKSDNKKHTMHFLPWERKVAISSIVSFKDNETTINVLEDAIKCFTEENDFTKSIRQFCD